MDTTATAVRELKDEFLECRDGNHAWSNPRYSFEERDRVVFRSRGCTRCDAMQTARIYRTTGEYIQGPNIKYPEGYLTKGHGRILKASVRRESLRRQYVAYSREAQPVAIRRSAERGRKVANG